MDAYYYVSSKNLFLALLLRFERFESFFPDLTFFCRFPPFQAVLLEYAEIQRGWKIADGGKKVVDVEPRASD